MIAKWRAIRQSLPATVSRSRADSLSIALLRRAEGGRAARATAFVLLAVTALPAPAQREDEREAPTEHTVLLSTPSVGKLLRTARSKQAAGPRRRDVSGPAFLRRSVVRAQDTARLEIEAMGIEVLGSAQSVLSALFVRATPEQAAAIGALPGVEGIVPARRYRPMLPNAAAIVNVSAAWVRPAGYQRFGDGLKIGFLDSGLDFEHPAFADPSLPPLPGYPKVDPGLAGFANSKVIAVRSYVRMLNSREARTSTPDDYSPWDASGHGTGVAMVAAGKRVDSPVGPVSGIAPKARIGVYKVFGTPGLNFYTNDSALIAALDDAANDGMDIVNLSLGRPAFHAWNAKGSECGMSFPNAACDPLAEAAQTLAEDFGVVVVAAAGNSGLVGLGHSPAQGAVNSPGTAPSVITVGGSGNTVVFGKSVRVGDSSFDARAGTGPDADGPLTAPAAMITDPQRAEGCQPYPEGSLLGKIVVVDRGDCLFVEKVEHADAAGAQGVLVINHLGDDLIRMALLEDTDIPAFFVGGADGQAIRELLADPATALTLDPTPRATETESFYVAPASSRGPTPSVLAKPDLVAPGLSIYTAAPRHNAQGTLYSPGGFRPKSGTSLATPMVSGAAALVWESYPQLSGRQVASALINSARPGIVDLLEDDSARLTVGGSGLLDIGGALRPTAVVVPPSLNFGSVRDAPFPVVAETVITNKFFRAQSFRMVVEERDADPQARVTIEGSRTFQFGLGPNGSRSVRVRLEGSHPAPGIYEGRLKLTSLTGFGDVTIPYSYAVGDNEPFDAIRFRGRDEQGIEGEVATRAVTAKVLDRFGIPVVGRQVRFTSSQPVTRIVQASQRTSAYGLIFARVRYGGGPGEQLVVARVGDLEIPFRYEASGVRPRIDGVDNAARRGAPDASLGDTAVPGSLATIEGRHFAPFSSGPPATPQLRSLPVSLKGVSVAFDSGGISVAGRVHSVSEDLLTVQIPWELADSALGVATVKVRAGEVSMPFRASLAEADPGIFTYPSPSGGTPLGVAMRSDGSPVTPDNPAEGGEAVTLGMTGNGPVLHRPDTGGPASLGSTTLLTPGVRLGSIAAEVTYSGLDPALAGLYLLTFVVPEGVEAGQHRLQVQFGSEVSNEVLLPVAPRAASQEEASSSATSSRVGTRPYLQ